METELPVSEVLQHQYNLEKELRERTTRELESHEKQIGELYTARNKLIVRIDRLEQIEIRRKWLTRVVLIIVIGLIVKALWPVGVALIKRRIL